MSRLGYGLAGIMHRERRGEDISAAGRVLEAVLDGGINFLDSAAAYGSTEQIIGNSIAHRRDEYVLATKFGADVGRGGPPFTAQSIAASVDRSLRRMKTDHLDVLQLHSPEPHHDLMRLDRDLIVEAMLRAKEAGKTRYLGYSGDNEAAQWAVASGAFDTLQTSFNLVDQHARAGLLASAKGKNMGIIIKRPIAMGMWGTGAPTHGNYTYEAYVERVQAMQQAEPVPAAPADPIELALGFLFAHPEPDTAIVATMNLSHLQMNIELMERGVSLATETLAELYRRYDQHRWRQIT